MYSVVVEKLELKEAFCQLGKVKVHQIQTSRLWGHMRAGRGVGRAAHTYLLPAADVTCSEREGGVSWHLPPETDPPPSSTDGPCNAVWDGKLGLCYGLLECTRGHMVGVKVYAVPDAMKILTNKVGIYTCWLNLQYVSPFSLTHTHTPWAGVTVS